MILCCNHFSVIMIITVAIIVFCPAKSISPQEKDRKSLELIKARVRLDPSQMLKNWDPGQGFKDACKMVGISCDRQKRVIGIDIAHFNLVGELYMVVGCLDRLQSLNISHNYFSGSIPLALFYSHDLVFLDLSHNRFHGFVPAQIGLLKSLQALDFSHNLLEGEMPANITMCKSLLRLNLGHNRFSGMVFSSILPLESLVHLEIQSNRFSGIIPPEIKNWAHLETFNIANNRFHGEIPAELDMLPKIISINLSFNRFKYSLEAFSGLAISLRALSLQGNFRSGGYYLSIGFYPQLEVLDLTNNFLAGQFPLLLCSMTSLRILRLAQNSIKGRLPEEIGSMSNLEVLDLSNNLLRGNIPPNIGQLKRLEFLDLSDNQFSNTIPSTIYDCQSLKSINLALNKLNGMIPSISIGQLTKVEYLNLSENSLVGSIPEELVYLVNIKAIDFSVNKLSNTIPSSIQSLPRLQHFDVHQNLLNGPVPDNPMFRRMPLYYFWNNSGLCGWVNASPCPINSEKLEKNGARAAAVMIIVIIILLAGVVWRVYNRRPDLLLQQTLPSSIRIMLKYSFTSSKLEVATRGFCEENCIGEGLKYKVYKGVLDDRSVVAIKLFKDEFREQVSIGSFVNECKAIVQLRHQNLVTVLGWCANSRHMAIVMEFMGNGSLEECLLDEDCPLIWSQRLDIALDVAQGLLYLHQRWQHAVHCDLKADNILLDDDCHAHISELKVRSTVSENITPATYRRPRGSLGYIAPG